MRRLRLDLFEFDDAHSGSERGRTITHEIYYGPDRARRGRRTKKRISDGECRRCVLLRTASDEAGAQEDDVRFHGAARRVATCRDEATTHRVQRHAEACATTGAAGLVASSHLRRKHGGSAPEPCGSQNGATRGGSVGHAHPQRGEAQRSNEELISSKSTAKRSLQPASPDDSVLLGTPHDGNCHNQKIDIDAQA